MLENQSLRNEEASLPNGHDVVSEHHLGVTRSTARPVSMFEPRDSTQHRPPIGRKVSHCSHAIFRFKISMYEYVTKVSQTSKISAAFFS